MPRQINPALIPTGATTPYGGASVSLGGLSQIASDTVLASEVQGVPLDAQNAYQALLQLYGLAPVSPPGVGLARIPFGNIMIPSWGSLDPADVAKPYWPDFYDGPSLYPATPRALFNDAGSSFVAGYPDPDDPDEFPVGTRSATTDTDTFVTGVVCPADRGVLAIFYLPHGNTWAGSTTQVDVESFVYAAILLDGGVDQTPCQIPGTGGLALDPGSDPFAFPGKAAGLWDLSEVHNVDPTAGRVRMSDTYTIQILGAQNNSTPAGDDSQFFAYRLPLLHRYDILQRTPEAEWGRYFGPASALPPDNGVTLDTAGDYPALTPGTDYWPVQIARFRQVIDLTNAPEAGSFALVHFRSEQAFENYVFNGTLTSDDIYSASFGGSPDNFGDAPNSEFLPTILATSQHTVRANIYLNTVLPTPSVPVTNEFGFQDPGPGRYLSGVEYYTPQAASIPGRSYLETSFDQASPNLFDWAFYTHSAATGAARRFYNANPIYIGTAPFARSVSGPGVPEIQFEPGRLELAVNYLDPSDAGGTAWPNSYPTAGDSCGFDFYPATIGEIFLNPDTDNPYFSSDAVPRIVIRYPWKDPDVYVPAYTAGPAKILWHSSEYAEGPYSEKSVIPSAYVGYSQADPDLFTARKDIEERFLCETYRYRADWDPDTLVTTPNAPAFSHQTELVSGTPSGIPIFVPIHPTKASGAEAGPWWRVAYFSHLLSGAPLVAGEAQVAGFPDREPDVADHATSRLPSCGVLQYPQDDYSTGYDPSGPDYGALAAGPKAYVRAFDTSFSDFAGPDATHSSRCVIRLRGVNPINLDPSNTPPDLRVFVKIPGLTAWLDIASPWVSTDFDVDNTGCGLLSSPATRKDMVDANGFIVCQYLVNLGVLPPLDPDDDSKTKILILVVVSNTVDARALRCDQPGGNGDARGLMGIQIVPPGLALDDPSVLDECLDTGIFPASAWDTTNYGDLP